MYIRRTQRVFKGRTYTNHLLVESVQTPRGPRQRTICSLGSLAPAPAADWLGLAHKLQSALAGQGSLGTAPSEAKRVRPRARRGERARTEATLPLAVDRVEVEEARPAGPVHVGHQVWQQLGLDAILGRAGLSPRACTLTEVMTLNRSIAPPISDYRLKPGGKTVIKFEERAADSPEAVKASFYPGDNYGHDFVYPKAKAVQLAKANHTLVPSMPDELAANTTQTATVNEPSVVAMKTASLKAQQPTEEEVEIAEVFAVSQLPKTTSTLPLIGVLSLGMAGYLRLAVAKTE